eukprot:CAMPEP_0197561062 /NCGR_PEP_ID=MMETSP1320-20131121/24421_1 /TAXON_ID=91990 /ORGANISM="Bolidomonas sp., Strain RCC2347" /LENGTH=1592 /DNA_ID=CAMNT_0043122663 /DNA_START=58 /DNA_END=4832 /DNA_ORIENTATION=-
MEARDYAQEMEVFESDEEAGVVSGQRVFFDLNCPDFLKIAFTPEAIRTLNTMSQMMKVTPDVFETLSQERALQELEEMWLEVDETKVQNLGREQVLPIVNKFLGTSITGVDSMSAEEIDKMVQVFIDIVDKDKDGSISFFELEEAVKDHKMSAKSIFENQSSLIRIENAIGIDLHFACVAQLGEEDTARAEAFSGFELCEVGFTKSLKLGADFMSRQRSRFFKESDYLALKFENDVFEMLSELNISAFQKIIVPLQLSAGHQMNTAASRFSPAMVLDPKTDALETVTMQVRSCFVVEAHVAIEVQIMVVQRNDDSRHEDFARRRDNRKLSPEDKINALLENATEDFRLSLKESERASIPLSCLISSKLHLLRIRDVSQGKWRSPIKIDRDFLWNISNQKEISNLHRSIGIRVDTERLTIHKPTAQVSSERSSGDRRRANTFASQAWDTTIHVLPSIVLSNSLPFPISVRCRQRGRGESEGSSSSDHHQNLLGQLYGGKEGKEHSGMRRKSRLSTAFGKNHKAIKPKKYTKNKTFKKQKSSSSGRPGTSSSRANQAPFRMEGKIGKGKELKLTGVNMAESMLVSICRESDGWWSQEVELQVSDLLTGGQKLSPVKSSLRSGDVKFTISGVTTPSQIHRLSIFSPYWLVNKTGYSLSYKISGTKGKEISDQSLGGLPVLTDAGTSGLLDGNLDGSSLQCIPNTGLFLDILNEFWGDSTNGNCVSQKNLDLTSRDVPVKYSDKIGLDNVGQEGEIACGNLIFGVTVETLTGIFVESNLITFTPRFFARNKLARSIVLVALRGKKEVVTKAGAVQKLWLDGQFEETQVLVEPGENAVIYYFDDLNTGSGGGGGGGINSVGAAKERFICFRTQQPTGGYSEKVHIVPADRLDTVHFSERSSTHTVDSIIVSKNTKSGASTVVTIEDSSCMPPFRIENRSADHSLLLVQEGENDAEPIFLEPLTWCNYAFDNPHGWRHSGTLRLKVAVVDTTSGYGVPGGNIRESDLPRVTKMKGIKMSGLARGMQKMMSGSSSALLHRKGKSATGLLGGIEEVGSPASNSGLNSSAVSAKSAASASGSLMSSEYLSDSKVSAKVLSGSRAKSYSIDKVGRRKDLPCPKPSKKSEDENHGLQHQGHLVVEVGILRGTKVITFNDSMYKINQSKIGMIKSGGDWRNVQASVSLEGVIVNLIDNTPHEILNLTLKELVAIKQRGDITFTIRLRHLQVDNMLEGARYPLVLQPVTQGLVDDRTSQNLKSGNSEAAAGGEGPVYWEEHMEKPVPFFELSCSYIPLESMIWIPLMYVQLTPLKLQVDLGYILKLANVITSSIPDANTVITEDDIAVAYAPVERKFEVLDKARPEGGEAEGGAEGEDGGPEESSERYAFVERLYVSQTWLELELFLRSEKTGAEERALADKQLASERRKAAEASEVLDRARKSGGMWAKSTGERDRSDSEDEEDETEGDLEALNSFGRTTSSSVSANLLTWLTNIAGSFAHISPTFSFANLDIPNHFGPLDVLFSHVGRHYLSKLLYQSYKLFSIHLLGDPFSLVNSITTGALNFITITRDELMAKGHKGFGGGVKSLVQGVVGGTSKSTSMAL